MLKNQFKKVFLAIGSWLPSAGRLLDGVQKKLNFNKNHWYWNIEIYFLGDPPLRESTSFWVSTGFWKFTKNTLFPRFSHLKRRNRMWKEEKLSENNPKKYFKQLLGVQAPKSLSKYTTHVRDRNGYCFSYKSNV